ncbi:lysosomal acid phosphatase-like [Xenentodon cancila]
MERRGFPQGQCLSITRLSRRPLLFRHGDRSPIKSYPSNPNKEKDWPQGFGQLSQEGMRQHLNLGQFLRTRYKNFLTESYDRNEIYVRSTDFDRTLMSAASTLAGLYPPSGHQLFMPGLNWQPIPVHTVSRSEEKLLSYPSQNCPLYTQLMSETRQSEEYVNVTETYQSLHNLPAPDWVTPEIMEDLKIMKNFVFQSLFGIHKQLEKSRLQGGILLGEIVKNLSKMALPGPKPQLKMMLLSAHDTAIAALQSSLDLYNGLLPPYASCHMIELYTEDDGSASVSMFYRNDSTVSPYQLQLPGCALDCPLEDFVRITKPSISEDRDKECQLPSQVGDGDFTSHHQLSSPKPTLLMPLRKKSSLSAIGNAKKDAEEDV